MDSNWEEAESSGHNRLEPSTSSTGRSNAQQVFRRRRQRNRRNMPQSNRGMGEVYHSENERQVPYGNAYIEESDIPGFAYDPRTRRYFRLQPQSSGAIIGYRECDLRENRRQNLLTSAHEQHTLKPCPSVSWLPKMIHRRELLGSNMPHCSRQVAELSLRGVRKKPSYVQKGCTDIESMVCCHYVDVSKDGKTIVGCWSVRRRFDEEDRSVYGSRLVCFKVEADPDDTTENQQWSAFGLKIRSSAYAANLLETNLVDMCVEPVNDDITCALYITSQTICTMEGRISTLCRVRIEPLAEFCSVNDPEQLGAPRYNMRWTCQEFAFSVAFNKNRMGIGVGLERNALLLDILTERAVRVDSFGRNVLSQGFSADGNLMFMGLKGEDVICSDLRTSNRRIIATFDGSKSVGWLKVMRSKPDMFVAEDHFGVIKLWDMRARKPLLTIDSNKDPYKKTPMYIDRDERIILSATCDGMTRAWSTYSGEKLCEFPSHRPRNGPLKPQIAYSSNWGGFSGNAAILVATGGDFRVHELVL